MTPVQLETLIRQRYNAVGDNFFTQAEIFGNIYAAQCELAMETFCIRNTYTTSSVANQRVYDFPTKTISIRRVEYNGKRIFPNDFVEDDDATGNNPGTTSTGTPEWYQTWDSELYLRPIPATAVTDGIKIYSYDLPDTVTSTGSIDVPDRYHLLLVDFVLYTMFAKEKNFNMAKHHYDIWQKNKDMVLQTERMRDVGDEFTTVKNLDEDF